MQPGLVSVIVPVYNRPEMLVEAVQSVLDQNYSSIQIVIVDDGSTDSTPEVIQSLLQQHSNIHAMSIENSGPGIAREHGRQIAKGEFIQYLDSDDILLPQKFAKQVAGLQQNPDLDVSYCQTSTQSPAGKILSKRWKRTGECIKSILPSMLSGRWWGTSTPLYRSRVIDQAGPWLNLINEEDWEYDCRIGTFNGGLHYVPEVLSIERHHDFSRLSDYGTIDPNKLASRAQAHLEVLKHANTFGVERDSIEYVTFLKSLFLLSRSCGAAGLSRESQTLFEKARTHGYEHGLSKLQLNIYSCGARLFGWKFMGKLSLLIDRIRS